MSSPSATTGNAQYFSRTGQQIRLAGKLASGGEGKIFGLLDYPAQVAKIYIHFDNERGRKLQAMLRAVPADPSVKNRNQVSICWPQDILLTNSGEVAGFVMPKLDTSQCHPVGLLWNPEDRGLIAPGFTWKYLIVSAANIASLVDLIHGKGHVIGDLNEENFLVSQRALATLVDCDSMQIRDPNTGEIFRSGVAREAYISAELLGKTLRSIDRTQHQDHWALAILIFEMLMEGQHPTNGIGIPEERGRRIEQGIFPLLGGTGLAAPPHAISITVLPEPILRLFLRCFRDGHKSPELRPTALEWKTTLQKLATSLVQCRTHTLHWFSPHLPDCPWCEEQMTKGIDRFAGNSSIFVPTAVTFGSTPEVTLPISVSATPNAPGQDSKLWILAVVAVIILFILILAAAIVQRNREETQRAEQARQEQIRRVRAVLEREEEERAAAEARRLEELKVQQLAEESARRKQAEDYLREARATLSSRSTIIVFQNVCSSTTISAIAHFTFPDGSQRSITRGWFMLKPFERREVGFSSSPLVFYYANSDPYVWQGNFKEGDLEAEVVDDPFAHIENTPFFGTNKRKVVFRHQFARNGEPIRFTCSSK